MKGRHMYQTRYIHKISPRDTDVGPEITLNEGDFADSCRLARALREHKILESGRRLGSFRVEGNKVVCFPAGGIWHSIILTRVDG